MLILACFHFSHTTTLIISLSPNLVIQDPALAAREAILEKVDYAVITQKAKEERDQKESHEKTRRRAMIERGLALDNVMSVDDQF